MSNTSSSAEWPPWAQAGLFFALAFGGIQSISAVLQGGVTLPALVSACIAALTGAGIIYSYEWRRQAGLLDDLTEDDSGGDDPPGEQRQDDSPDDSASSAVATEEKSTEAATTSTDSRSL